jgi:Raf kinase inhibitor-like YbhB/YbcL family protein
MRAANVAVLELLCVLAGCGAGDGAMADAASPRDGGVSDGATDAAPTVPPADAPVVPLTLTSTAITEGGSIPEAHSCEGADVSPPLAWVGGPAVPGYALVFTDVTSPEGFLHSILWDIPGDVTSLPQGIEKVYMPPVPAGSRQPLGYDESTRGYLGPCPGSMHRYQFALHAVDVYPLPGVGSSSSQHDVQDVIVAHSTARATLTATFTPGADAAAGARR